MTISKLPLALLAATLVFGQGSGANTGTAPAPATLAQMRVNQLASTLNLTDAQKASALSIFTTSITSAQTLQDSLRTNQTSLADAVKKNDTATIDSLSTASGVLQGKIMAINAKADAAFYALLTTEQKALYDARPHGGPGGGRGPGGMGGPGQRGRRG
jgi:Spy/CpxP family protein refolding chaperone